MLLERARSRRPAGFLHRQRRAHRRRPRPSRQIRDHPARSSVEPFLQFSARRDLRETRLPRLDGAGRKRRRNRQSRHRRRDGAPESRARASVGLRDLRPLPPRRHDGEDAASGARSSQVGLGAGRRQRAARTRRRCRRSPPSEGGNFKVAPWDWRYLSEKRRKAEFDFDEGELKPYLQLDRIIEAAFYAASRLFGLEFAERFDLKLYHPDVRAWEVRGGDGEPKALFLGDYFARPSKRSGAWMSSFRGQQKLDEPRLPIVVNVMNFAKGAEGETSLLERRRCAHALP